MNCKEEGCAGVIDTSVEVLLMVGCSSYQGAHPCNTCGRIHWPSGDPVFNRQSHKAFLVDGWVVHRDVNNQPVN